MHHRLWVFAAALLFSTGGAAIKGNSLTAFQVASFRSLVAALTMALLLPASRRNWNWRYWMVGVAYATTLVAFVTANKLTTAANAIFLQSTAPAWLIFLSPLLLKEHIRRSDVYLLIGVGLGMGLFFVASEPARATAPDPITGNIIAAASGLAWALTLVGLRWLSKREPGDHAGMATVVVGNILACGVALPFALPATSLSTADLGSLLYLGIFQIGLAYYCLNRAIARIPAFEAATLLLVEPALNPVWTWLILAERPATLSIAGGVVILSSTLANTWWLTRARPFGAASRNS